MPDLRPYNDDPREDDRPLIDTNSMVTRTVRRLAERSLTAGEGDYLGSETDLVEVTGVSRPTLRQAGKILERDGLLSIRRGVKGGFYAARPDARHVVEAPALWLRSRQATLGDVARILGVLLPGAAAAASRCVDPLLIDDLRRHRDEIARRLSTEETTAQAIAFDTGLQHTVAAMSANAFFVLVNDIAYAFGLLEPVARYPLQMEERRVWLQMQRSLCDSILNGDDAAARLIAAERARLACGWLNLESED